MPTTDPPLPSFRQLLAAWWELTRLIGPALRAEMNASTDQAVGAVKDTILDLGSDEGPRAHPPTGEALPPVSARQLAEALGPQIRLALRRAAKAVNEDPWGCWAGLTEERVAAIFRELGQAALDAAFELRVAAAEARREAGSPREGWAKRYRRMMAREGHWPPSPS